VSLPEGPPPPVRCASACAPLPFYEMMSSLLMGPSSERAPWVCSGKVEWPHSNFLLCSPAQKDTEECSLRCCDSTSGCSKRAPSSLLKQGLYQRSGPGRLFNRPRERSEIGASGAEPVAVLPKVKAHSRGESPILSRSLPKTAKGESPVPGRHLNPVQQPHWCSPRAPVLAGRPQHWL